MDDFMREFQENRKKGRDSSIPRSCVWILAMAGWLWIAPAMATQPNFNIAIDGDMSDWATVPDSVTDSMGDNSKPGTDVLEMKVAHNHTHLFIYTRHAGAMLSEDAGGIGQGRYYWLAFLDLDNNTATGFNPTITDPECYSPSMVGNDLELIFEREWSTMVGDYVIQHFYGNGGVGNEDVTELEILNGVMRLGPGDYDEKAQFKFLTDVIPDGMVLTNDIRRSGYTPGEDVFMTHAFSQDMTEVEVAVDFRAALVNENGIPNLRLGNTITVGFACESSPWDDCGDGTDDLLNYTLERQTVNCSTARTLVLSCSGGVGLGGDVNNLRLRFNSGISPATACELTACPTENILVDCVIDCEAYAGLNDCNAVLAALANDIGACIDDQASGLLTWTPVSGVGLLVEGTADFHCCLVGSEVGAPGMGDVGYPLDFCPIYNLCDGIRLNETSDPSAFAGGLGMACQLGDCRPTPTPTNTPTATNTPEATPSPTRPFQSGQDCDSGYYILDSFGGRHRIGNPYQIMGSLYFGNPIAVDMERAVCDISGATNEDLVVLDGYGAAHFVMNTDCNLPQDFYFGDSDPEDFPQGRAVDLVIAADSQGFWVLTDFGGIYRAGSTKGGSDPAAVDGTATGSMYGYDVPITGAMRAPTLPDPGGASLRAVALIVIDEDADSRADGYVILDSMGGRLYLNEDGDSILPGASVGSPANDPFILLDPIGYVWPFFVGLDIARDMELYPTQQGVVILDGWGGIHPVPVNVEDNPVYFANNRVSNADPTPVQAVGMPYVTQGFDNPLTFEDEGEGTVFGADAASIFTDLEFSVGCARGLYTLDKFGGVFVLGEARPVDNSPTPDFGDSPYFFPYLYAEDLEVFGADEAALTGFTAN
jgi:hypothetical protein